MMESISFFVHGIPTPKGSLTRMPNGAMVPAGTAESRRRFANWRDDVKLATIDAMGDLEPWAGPVRLMVEFALPYPRSSMRKYQLGWLGHTKKPDVDKLLRAVCDPMKGIAWHDDSQVCFATINKVYAWDGRTGARIMVDFLDDAYMHSLALAHAQVVNVVDSL